MIYLYADGSSEGGRGVMGWGWVITHNGEVVYAGYGGDYEGTNNIAELTAALEGLTYLLECPILDSEGITLVSDSRYTLGIASGEYIPQKNLKHAKLLRDIALHLKIRCFWVKGHNGNQLNEIVDDLAGMGRRKFTTKKKYKNRRKKRSKL